MTTTRSTRLLLAAALLALAPAGCGGASGQASETTPPPEGGETEAAAPPVATEPAGWESMGFDARAALMRERVIPEMGAAFRAFDAEDFETFTCATCHGADFQDARFRMPNGLHPLDPSTIPTLAESSDEEVARAARFMFAEVVPGMVGILGVPRYDPETGTGFGCLSCHERAGAPE